MSEKLDKVTLNHVREVLSIQAYLKIVSFTLFAFLPAWKTHLLFDVMLSQYAMLRSTVLNVVICVL